MGWLVLIAVALAYGGGCVAVFAVQRSFMYFPPAPLPPGVEAQRGIRAVGTGDERVEVLRLPAAPDAPTVVYFHGNAAQLPDGAWLGAQLRERGMGFYGVEYPGYGHTPGPVTEERIYAAAERALASLRESGVPAERTVLLGQSLGSGVAAEMARRGLGARLILVSAYTSMVEMGRRQFPYLPVGWLVKDRFDTLDKAPGLKLPALVIHGDRDEVVPFEMGREVARQLPGARFVALPKAGHNDVWDRGGPSLLDEVAAFAWGRERL